MKKLLDTYLESIGLTRYKVSRATKISPTTLQRSSDKDAFTINPRILWGISLMIDKTPGKILDEIIKMEEENGMTTDEIQLFLSKIFKELGVNPYIYTSEDTVIAEIDLLGDDDPVRFAVYYDENITRCDILQNLGQAMRDFDMQEGDNYYPTLYSDQASDKQLVTVEYMAISKESSDYLADIGKKILKLK